MYLVIIVSPPPSSEVIGGQKGGCLTTGHLADCRNVAILEILEAIDLFKWNNLKPYLGYINIIDIYMI